MSTIDIPTEVKNVLKDILTRRQDVTILAARQRSKFEHWLKFELAVSLSISPHVQNLRLEDSFPSSSGRCDISFMAGRDKWYIELKTSNVNWRAPGLEDRTRPITRNIDGIIADIKKLRAKCSPAKGIAAFVLFPIPVRIWQEERNKLSYHLDRIENECQLDKGELFGNADFVPLDSEFGMTLFVVEVV